MYRETRGRVIDFWIAFSNVVIIVGRLIRQAPGLATAGRPDPPADRDLLAQALTLAF